MKYLNIKRYKFSTIIRSLRNLADDILDFLKFINFKKAYKYLNIIETTDNDKLIDNFSLLPDFSKWILTVGMILGRLELFAIIVLFIPSFWRKY